MPGRFMTVATAKSFNIDITQFATDIKGAAAAYTSAISTNPALQTKCELAYPEIAVQELRPVIP